MQRLEFSDAVRPLWGSLGFKGLKENVERIGKTFFGYEVNYGFIFI